MLSVVTATYNRKHLLTRLYDSLIMQTCKNFEWIVVDDGSTDGTDELINELIIKSHIRIKYIKKSNGGKHKALNIGVEKCEGEIIFFVDSDDYLLNDAVEFIEQEWSKVKSNFKFAGISGIKVYQNGSIIGTNSSNMYDDVNSFEYRYKLKIQGDKAEVFRKDILLKYKFPEFPGEKFLPEAVVFNRIAYDGYLLRWTNKPLTVCEYREDGLTNSGCSLFANSWKGYSLYCKELASYREVDFIFKLKIIINYFRLALIYKKSPLNLLRKEKNYGFESKNI